MTEQHNLSEKAIRVIEFIDNYVRENDYGPTVEEIAPSTGLCGKGHVCYYVKLLAQANYLERVQHIRGYRVTDLGRAALDST